MTRRRLPRTVTLVTEATYPHKHGGVSVWCDRLIRGMNEVDFEIVSLCDDEREKAVWELPPNVAGLSFVPLGMVSAVRRGRPSRRARSDFAAAVETFVLSLSGEPGPGTPSFVGALEGLYRATRPVALDEGMWMADTFDAFAGAWNRISMPRSFPDSGGVSLATTIRAIGAFIPLLRPFDYTPAPAEIVHVTANGLAMVVGLAHKWEHGSPIVLTEHGVYLRERYLAPASGSLAVRQLQLRFFAHLAAAGLQEADLIAPVSDFNRRWELKLGADDAKIRVIYNGVDPGQFPLLRDEPESPTLVYVGRIDPIKDLETLIDAFALVQMEEPAAILRIFGPVPPGNEAYSESLSRRVRDLGLSDQVIFEGNAGIVSDAHRAGHAVVLSSISEGLPFSVIEAMMSGRATVSTDVGGVSEVVDDAGLVVPSRDPKSLAEACLLVLRNGSLRRELGRKARQRALSKFTIGKFLTAYRQLYADVKRIGLGNGFQPVAARKESA